MMKDGQENPDSLKEAGSSQDLGESDERTSDLAKTATLLKHVFGSDRFSNIDYVRWLYDDSPEGKEIAVNFDSHGRRSAHYCAVPVTYHRKNSSQHLALSLNGAVSEEIRRRSVFVRLAQETCVSAARDHGIEAIIGVANANSTPAFLRRLNFELLQSLPVRMGFRPGSKFHGEFHRVDTRFLESQAFRHAVNYLDFSPSRKWAQKWWPEKLLWRLKSPASVYHFHLHESGALISTCDRTRRIPVTIALKFFPHLQGTGIDSMALLASACASHGSLCFLYAGFNESAKVRGVLIPRFFLPAPLNLIYKPLSDDAPRPRDFSLSAFEFLDFDAY
jgi:hypothetical protein